jgi:hypothetical protein
MHKADLDETCDALKRISKTKNKPTLMHVSPKTTVKNKTESRN